MWMFRLQQRIMFTYRGLQHCLQKNLNVICINSWAIIWGLRLFPSHSVWSEPDRALPSQPHFLPGTRNICAASTEIYSRLVHSWCPRWGLRLIMSLRQLSYAIKSQFKTLYYGLWDGMPPKNPFLAWGWLSEKIFYERFDVSNIIRTSDLLLDFNWTSLVSTAAPSEIYRNWATISDWLTGGLVLVTNIMINQWFSVKDQDQQNPMFSEACQGPTLKILISIPIIWCRTVVPNVGLTSLIFYENNAGSI